MAPPPVAGVICEELTAIDGLVLGDLLASVTLVAVTVKLPLVPKVTLKAFVPATRSEFVGRVAVVSLLVILIVSVAVLIRFQFAYTALTVTLKAGKATWGRGVPVLPEAVPGAAVSPGNRTCNFVTAPALTVKAGLVFADLVLSVISLALRVALPAVFKVMLKVLVPELRTALPGMVELLSDEV